MERDLLELFEAAKKAADAATKDDDPAQLDRCVDALRRLREVPVTVSVLVETQVGKKLRTHLVKHPIKKIQNVASDLCELWKKKVIEETAQKKGNGVSEKSSPRIDFKSEQAGTVKNDRIQKSNSGASAANSSTKVEKSEKVKVESLANSESSKSESFRQHGGTAPNGVKVHKDTNGEQRSSASSGSSLDVSLAPKLKAMVKCNDAVRDKTRELFAEALSKVSEEAQEDIRDEVQASDPVRVAVVLESVMFEKLGRSNGAQKQKYRSILFNLKDQNNPDLRRRVLLGHVKPENLINMTAEDMASDERKLQNKQIKEKALFDCERGIPPKASTDQFKCGRCGQRKTTYYQMQTRSADEPMTTYVTCVNCNNRWKFC